MAEPLKISMMQRDNRVFISTDQHEEVCFQIDGRDKHEINHHHYADIKRDFKSISNSKTVSLLSSGEVTYQFEGMTDQELV